MNHARIIGASRVASCQPIKSFLGHLEPVRSQSSCHYATMNRQVARVSGKVSSTLGYTTALSLGGITPKRYSQGPNHESKMNQGEYKQKKIQAQESKEEEASKFPDETNKSTKSHNNSKIDQRKPSNEKEQKNDDQLHRPSQIEGKKDPIRSDLIKFHLSWEPGKAQETLWHFIKNFPSLVIDSFKEFSRKTKFLVSLFAAYIAYLMYQYQLQKDMEIIQKFNEHCTRKSQENSNNGDLTLKENLQNLELVLKFLGNESWDLIGIFQRYINQKLLSVETKKVVYLHGDPGKFKGDIGIGKSTAFSSLVHNMSTGSTQVQAILQKAFPFLTHFKHFIYIDAAIYNFQNEQKGTLNLIVNNIKKKSMKTLVVIDDAHLIFQNNQKKLGQYFYDQLNGAKEVKLIVLLSSQGPVPNSAHLKNLDGPQF